MARLKTSKNMNAFLDMLAFAEGTKGVGDDGYNVIVRPGGLMTSYDDHPRKRVKVRDGLYSTAAGRYMLLERNWDAYRQRLNLRTFGPEQQDAIAIQLITECRAVADVEAGRIDAAVRKCASRWASLPGAGYGQPEKKMGDLLQAYLTFGGTIA